MPALKKALKAHYLSIARKQMERANLLSTDAKDSLWSSASRVAHDQYDEAHDALDKIDRALAQSPTPGQTRELEEMKARWEPIMEAYWADHEIFGLAGDVRDTKEGPKRLAAAEYAKPILQDYIDLKSTKSQAIREEALEVSRWNDAEIRRLKMSAKKDVKQKDVKQKPISWPADICGHLISERVKFVTCRGRTKPTARDIKRIGAHPNIDRIYIYATAGALNRDWRKDDKELLPLTNKKDLQIFFSDKDGRNCNYIWAVRKLKNLAYLRITNCSVKGDLVRELTGLRALHILGRNGSQQFNRFDIGSLAKLDKLVSFRITNHSFTVKSRVDGQGDDAPALASRGLELLRKLPDLVDLSLVRTEIDDFAFLRGLAKLNRLSLAHTQFGDSDVKHLRRLKDLETLDIGFTQVRSFPVRLPKALTKLKRLSVEGNKLGSFTLDSFGRESLEFVIATISEETVGGLRALTKKGVIVNGWKRSAFIKVGGRFGELDDFKYYSD